MRYLSVGRHLGVALIALWGLQASQASRGEPHRPAETPRIAGPAQELPVGLGFELNRGQAELGVQFLSRGQGHCLLLSPNRAVLALPPARPPVHGRVGRSSDGSTPPERLALVGMMLVGGSPSARPFQSHKLPGRVSYFRGRDPRGWRAGIPTYARVGYRGVYPGVDVVYYGRGRRIEYDFELAPGADPEVIRLRWEGTGEPRIDDQGDLVLPTPGGTLRQRRPYLYQEGQGGRQRVPGGYRLRGGSEVGFWVGPYDRERPLVIDPVLSYATYLGGSGHDHGNAIARDAQGNLYVVGTTYSVDFPVRASFETDPHPSPYGGYQQDAFVAKLDPTGAHLLYAVFLGGWESETGNAIAVDDAGNAYVTGATQSYHQDPVVVGDWEISPLLEGFPAVNAYQPEDHLRSALGDHDEAFVSKISPDGSTLLYSTYLGQQGDESGRAIALDRGGNVWVAGITSSQKSDEPYLEWYRDFPTTPDALLPSYSGGAHDIFLAQIDTRLAGPASLLYSTHLGGSGEDQVYGAAVDASGCLYLAGLTSSPNFPTTPGAFQTQNHPDSVAPMTTGDAFVTKWDPAAKRIVYSTLLGGSLVDEATAIAVDGSGSAVITGWTLSNELDQMPFPTTPGALQPMKGRDLLQCPYDILIGYTLGPCEDGFVARLNPEGSGLVYSTYLGGDRIDKGIAVAADAAGNAWVAGWSTSSNLPLTGDAGGLLPGASPIGTLAKLDPGGRLLLLAQTAPVILDLMIEPTGDLLLTGYASGDLVTTAGAVQPGPGGQTDAFIARITGLDTPPAPPPALAPGDANGDGRLDILDAIHTLRALTGLVTLTPEQAAAAHVSGTPGGLSVVDVLLMLRKLAGALDRFPVEG